MLSPAPPSAASTMALPEPSHSAPTRTLSELKKGVRRYDELALTKEKLNSMKAAKAKPPIAKAATQPAAPRSATAISAAATTTVTAVGGPSSRLPILARTSSIPTRPISAAPGAYVHPPAFNVNDRWSHTTWSGERGGATTTVVGSGFQPIQKKKGGKRKTGKATTEWIVTPDDVFSNLPRGQARVTALEVNYVDERDNERFAAGGSRRHKAGSARGGGGAGSTGSDGAAGGRVLKDYGEDGKGSIYVSTRTTAPRLRDECTNFSQDA